MTLVQSGKRGHIHTHKHTHTYTHTFQEQIQKKDAQRCLVPIQEEY
jgi:hypothetical protein